VVTNILTAFEQNKTDIYSTTKLGAPVLNESLNGLSYRITPDFSYSSNLPWKLMPLKNILYDDKIYHEFEEREVAGIYWYRMAEMYLSENNEDLFNYTAGKALETGYDAVPVIGNMAIIITTPPLANFPVAEQLVKKALKLQPYNTELMSNLGSIYGNMGKYREAAEMFEKVIKLEPNNFNAMMFLNKAKEQMMQESMKKAMESARDAFFNDGMKLMKEKRFKDAAPYFQNDLEKNPALARSNFHLGLIHSINRDYSKAIPQFETALKKEPENFNTLNNLALTYIRLSKTAKAKEYFDKSLKINPDQERVKKMLQELK
jgi:tetratricopeptide (TPR) repeat protein